MAAKGASIREENPMQRSLDAVSDADASKIDGSAMRAARVEHYFRKPHSRCCLGAEQSYLDRRTFGPLDGLPRGRL
jgi:hypothetical protein